MDATPYNTRGIQRIWQPCEEALLGTMTDVDVAKTIGCSVSVARNRRAQLCIPPYSTKRLIPTECVDERPEPKEPTDARPGTVEKLMVLAARAERGESLTHPRDENVFRRSPVTSRRLAEMILTPTQGDEDDD